MTRFIDEQRTTFGVEPICRTLAIAPSSYYAAKARPPSARSVRDAAVSDAIDRIHRANYAVYGAVRLASTDDNLRDPTRLDRAQGAAGHNA